MLAVLLAAGWGAPFLAFPQARPQPSPSKKSRPAVDDFLNPASGPLSLPKLLELLRLVKEDIETEGRLLRAIEARGIDFPMSSANTARIVNAGGSEKLRQLLQTKAPTAAPPAGATKKPEEIPGSLEVQCEPVECEVSVQGGTPVSSDNGVARVSGLKAGELFVDVRKSGYIGQQHPVTVKPGAAASLAVQLDPDGNTKTAFGTRLFQAMIAAAGGDSRQKDFASISATGAATLFDNAGTASEWNLTVSFRSNLDTFEAKSAAGEFKLECRGETCQAQTGGRLFGKRLSREQAQALETAFRQFRSLHFDAFLDRLVAAKLQATATSATIPASGEQHLRLEGASDLYEVTLNTDLLPAFIAVQSKTGLGSGLALAFADYSPVGASRYPRSTEIKFPDGKQGLRVRLGAVNSAPAAK